MPLLAPSFSHSMSKKISRTEAQAKGLNKYFTGKPCRNGHTATRYVKSTNCIQCERAAAERRHNATDPDFRKLKKREKNLMDRYGITLADFLRMADTQDGRCAICRNLAKGDLNVDHCHETNKVRGLLCTTCNVLIGAANDDITKLQLAIDYLVKHS